MMNFRESEQVFHSFENDEFEANYAGDCGMKIVEKGEGSF